MKTHKTTPEHAMQHAEDLFHFVADYASATKAEGLPLHPAQGPQQLRASLGIDLPEQGRDAVDVIRQLITAAEPGLVGVTQPGFLAWVMGSSHPAGVAADWLAALWGQNAGLSQSAPAAAIAEEAVIQWLLELLDLPRTASVGITTGATMAGFVCLAAARGEVLRRLGFDISKCGLRGAPAIKIFLSDETHSTNFAALRYLGFGSDDFHLVSTNSHGVLDVAELERAMDTHTGPAIVIAQAGHIHTGAFDHFRAIAEIASAHGAWFHIDGAFGLWARCVPEMQGLADGAELADSWSVDGHKWLQVPYDCGFAIVRDSAAHRRSMDITAGYLPDDPADGRNPNQFGPELSRRARGFAVWAVLQTLGRAGVQALVREHCRSARQLAVRLAKLEHVRTEHEVVLNQVAVSFGQDDDTQADRDALTQKICDTLNGTGDWFLRTARWNDKTILRFSFSGAVSPGLEQRLADAIEGLIAT